MISPAAAATSPSADAAGLQRSDARHVPNHVPAQPSVRQRSQIDRDPAVDAHPRVSDHPCGTQWPRDAAKEQVKARLGAVVEAGDLAYGVEAPRRGRSGAARYRRSTNASRIASEASATAGSAPAAATTGHDLRACPQATLGAEVVRCGSTVSLRASRRLKEDSIDIDADDNAPAVERRRRPSTRQAPRAPSTSHAQPRPAPRVAEGSRSAPARPAVTVSPWDEAASISTRGPQDRSPG